MCEDATKSVPPATDSSGRFRFRIVHLLYVIAVVASSLATFGSGGVVATVVIVGFWAAVFNASAVPQGLRSGCLFLILCGLLGCCLMPCLETAREAARRSECYDNLRQIGLALHNYHSFYGSFPPAYVADSDGRPMHSWRVLILPFLGERALYDQYDFSEPWDGYDNGKLLSGMPSTYACPSRPRGRKERGYFTSYVAVVHPRTAWPGATPRKMAEIRDGTSNTILVVEASSRQIPWMEPRDPSLTETLDMVSSTDFDVSGGHRFEEFFYVYDDGRNVLTADGASHFLGRTLPRESWSNLLTIDDGAVLSDESYDVASMPLKKPRLDNWFRLGLFFLITLFPLPWVWGKSRSARRDAIG